MSEESATNHDFMFFNVIKKRRSYGRLTYLVMKIEAILIKKTIVVPECQQLYYILNEKM